MLEEIIFDDLTSRSSIPSLGSVAMSANCRNQETENISRKGQKAETERILRLKLLKIFEMTRLSLRHATTLHNVVVDYEWTIWKVSRDKS
jgi:hypothetical protein